MFVVQVRFGDMAPGSFPFFQSRLRLITVLGAGLLVGTALAVIIPEGVQSIYSAAENPGKPIQVLKGHVSLRICLFFFRHSF